MSKTTTYSQEKNDQVRSNESSEDTQIPPPVIERHAESSIELFSNLVGTVLASLCGIIDDISISTSFKERFHVFAAGEVRRRVEKIQFRLRTDNIPTLKLRHDHSANQAGERIELV